MILFVASWGADSPTRVRAVDALRSCAAIFPSLRATEVRQTPFSGGAHVAWAAVPRRGFDVASSEDRVSIVEGVCLADTTVLTAAGLGPATSADLPDELDGQFAIVDAVIDRLRIATDTLGLCPLYAHRSGDTWLVANRVELLARAIGATGIDLEGAAAFLSTGWVTGGGTLVRGVDAVPAGARWSFEPDRRPSLRTTGPAELAELKRRRPAIEELANALTARCAAVADWAGPPEAPLTAGLDSRLVCALLRAAGVEASYVTEGSETNIDVVFGKKLAQLTGVEHHVYGPLADDELRRCWPDLARRMVAQNDGMVSLWQISNLMRPQSGRDVTLTGVGGEIGRGAFIQPRDLLPVRTAESLKRLVAERASDAHGLLTAPARTVGRERVVGFIQWALATGFRASEVRQAYFTFERVGRWAASNWRKATPTTMFAPLATRPFLDASYSLSPPRRYCEPLHYGLMQELAPDLHAFPFARGGWRSQMPYYNLAQFAVRRLRRRSTKPAPKPPPKQASFIETMRTDIMARCLDRQSSSSWEIVDRSAFEALMRGDAAGRARAALSLLGVLTLVEYEDFRAEQPAADGTGVAVPGVNATRVNGSAVSR